MQQPGIWLPSSPTSQTRPESCSAALISLCSCIARHILLQQLHHASTRKCSLRGAGHGPQDSASYVLGVTLNSLHVCNVRLTLQYADL